MLHRAAAVLALAASTAACLCPPGQTRVGNVCKDSCSSNADCQEGERCDPGGCVAASSSSSSSGGTPTSSSGVQASSAGAADAGSLALESLCPRLATGFLRSQAAYFLRSGLHECAPAFSSEREALATVMGSDFTPEAVCSPDGGMVWDLVQRMAASVNQGRALYHGQAAAACAARGDAFARQHGPFWQWPADAGGDTPPWWDTCPGILEGRVPPGGTCTQNTDCAPVDGGARCVQPLVDSCEAHCTPEPGPGEACLEGSCGTGLVCTRFGVDVPVCVQPRAEGASCRVDAGYLPCQGGLACMRGACRPLPLQGQECEGFCAAGLLCNTDTRPATCMTVTPEEGGPCSNDGWCGECLRCHPDPARDAGNGPISGPWGSCRAPAGLGEPCANLPCHLGLACVGGLCVQRAGTGQPCQAVDARDDAVLGSCAMPDDACVGTPPRCTPRQSVGECFSLPGEFATAGTCQPPEPLVAWQPFWHAGPLCLRAHAQDTQGTCTPPGVLGETCGEAHDLQPACAEFLLCAQESNSQGICAYSYGNQGPPGALCAVLRSGRGAAESACAPGLFCKPTSWVTGTCTPTSAGGSACGSDPQCGDRRCVAGDTPDAGICLPWPILGAPCDSEWACGPSRRCVLEENDAGHCAEPQPAWSECAMLTDCGPEDMCFSGRCVPQICTPLWSQPVSDAGVSQYLFAGGALTGLVVLVRRRRRS